MLAYQALYEVSSMAAAKIERRVYALTLAQLFGACVTALGQLGASVERHDVERGTIVAHLGARPLAPVSELSLVLQPHAGGQTELVATWRARKRGGDRRMLAAFLAAVDTLASHQGAPATSE
jgi:hypothetical protein